MAIEEPASLTQGALRSTSEAPPAHYILNIQQFSALTKHNVERYESNEFETGGYKWKLVIHPNGNKTKNAGEFLSIYLAITDTASLTPGWEVYATFRIFLLDQINDTYLKVEDEKTNGRRFHRLRTEWGFDQFISFKTFNDPNNAYLVGDNCVFGAEVFVRKERSKGKTESLSMVKDAVSYKNTWKINNYSKLNADGESSHVFSVGDHKWKVQLYPNGKGGIGGYISLNLALAEPQNFPSGTKILVEFTLLMLDQLERRHHYGKASYWFSASKPEWGWQRFISHGIFFKTNRGLLFKDGCCIEAEVAIHGESTVFG
ncbi:protein RESTRICTED TEV MOVEMENT 3-like isoform X2 [Bidens hawaiensis]|uniref:protein RESTRICTED TEV MOVEMENT 3-like isoform X2 n=1 Tax=Bidens hawaiensis TaxID=980011 RepID=UPI004049C744